MRITVAVIVLLVVALAIGGIAYTEVKSDRSKPLSIDHYPGLAQVSENKLGAGQNQERWQGLFQGLTMDDVDAIEAHYRRQMDSCEKVYGMDPEEFPDVYTIVCEKDRAHKQFGFNQLTSLQIQPQRELVAYNNEQLPIGELTGWVTVAVNNYWED